MRHDNPANAREQIYYESNGSQTGVRYWRHESVRELATITRSWIARCCLVCIPLAAVAVATKSCWMPGGESQGEIDHSLAAPGKLTIPMPNGERWVAMLIAEESTEDTVVYRISIDHDLTAEEEAAVRNALQAETGAETFSVLINTSRNRHAGETAPRYNSCKVYMRSPKG